MIIATDDADACGDLDKNLAGRRDITLAGDIPRLEEATGVRQDILTTKGARSTLPLRSMHNPI